MVFAKDSPLTTDEVDPPMFKVGREAPASSNEERNLVWLQEQVPQWCAHEVPAPFCVSVISASNDWLYQESADIVTRQICINQMFN